MPLLLRVERIIAFFDEEFEKPVISGFCQGPDGIQALGKVATLCNELVADFNSGFQNVLVQLRAFNSQKLSDPFALLAWKGKCLSFRAHLLLSNSSS